MEMTDKADHWQSLNQMLRGYRAGQILMTCNTLGIFRYLANGPRTAAVLAELTGAQAEALRRLLNAAVAMELLVRDEDGYANSRLATACLAYEGPFFLGNMARLEQAQYIRWGRLSEAVQTGQWPEPNREMEDQSQWVRRFELALYDVARTTGPIIAEALALPTHRPLRLIDVGGGHGGYTLALARRYPNLTATIFDLPAPVGVARDLIAAEGLSDRVTVQAGDFQKEPLGQGYDLALLFGVLLSETEEGKVALLRKVHAALAPGGEVAIRDAWLDPDNPAQSPEAAIFSLHLLLANSVGDVYSQAQLQSWLAEAGFASPRMIDLPDWAGAALCLARRRDQ